MRKIIKLHRYGNSTYYAIVLSNLPKDIDYSQLKDFFKELTKKLLPHYPNNVEICHTGLFRNFTDDFCNGKVDETCSHPLNDGDNFDPEVRPWQKYDYVNEKYVDWYGPLLTKGENDPEFKRAYEFSYRASFHSSLLKAGIKSEDADKTYVFEVRDYRGEHEDNPAVLPTVVIRNLLSARFLKDRQGSG